MKKIIGRLIAVIMLMFGNVMTSASADVIAEPVKENSFLESHRDKCEDYERTFYANGRNDKLTLYKSPKTGLSVDKVNNGFILKSKYLYKDDSGQKWVLVGYFKASKNAEVEGWVPFDYLVEKYSWINFEIEYADVIESASGEVDLINYINKKIYYFEYPGSSENYNLTINATEPAMTYYRTFIDEEGRKWVNVSYYIGNRDMWICLDNPTAEFKSLYPNGGPARSKLLTNVDEPEKTISPSGQYLLIIGVAVVVIAAISTLVVIIFMKKRGKKTEE